MLKPIIAALALSAAALVAAHAFATGTWSGADPLVRTATFTSGTESCAALGSTDGFSLSGVSGFSVRLKSNAWTVVDAGVNDAGPITYDAAVAFTAGSLLACACQNVNGGCATGTWSRASDSDLSVDALTSKEWLSFRSNSRRDRIAWVPSGIGQASVEVILGSPVSIYH
jgi:hypothetical protein